MVRIGRILGISCACCCALLLIACGGRDIVGPDALAGGEPEAVASPVAEMGLPGLLADDEVIIKTPPRAASAYTVNSYDGADYELAECHAVEYGLQHPGTPHVYDALGLWSKYSPYIDVPGIPVHYGFARYRLAGVGQAYPPAEFRKLVIEATPAYASDFPFPDDGLFPTPEYFLAVADWDHGGWQFIGGPYGELPEICVDLTTLGFTYLSPLHGHLDFLIVVPAEHNVLVHNSYLVLGDDNAGPPPAPPIPGVDAKTHEFYRAYRYNLTRTELGLYGSRYGQWGLEELGSDTGYAMYYRSKRWFRNHIGDPSNLKGITIQARPETPQSYSHDEYYFALPNFDTGGWEYFGPIDDYPEAYVDLSGVTYNFLSPLGNFYYMILVKENNGIVLENAVFNVKPKVEWQMFKHNTRRTSCTPHDGPTTNAVKWWFDVEYSHGQPILAPNGNLYTYAHRDFAPGAWSEDMAALDAGTGVLQWRIAYGRRRGPGTPCVGADSALYFGSSGTLGGALEAYWADGTNKWLYMWPSMGPNTSPMMDSAGTLYTGNSDGALYAVKQVPAGGGTFTPAIDWTYSTGAPVMSAPARDGLGRFHVANLDTSGPVPVTKFYCVQTGGTLAWMAGGFGFAVCYSTPAVGRGNTVYYSYNAKEPYQIHWPPDHGVVIALNPDGSIKWVYDCDYGVAGATKDCDIWGSPAIGPDGTVWVGTEDNNVLGLNGTTGALQWEFSTSGEVRTTPAVDGSGRVYFGSDDGYVYCIEPTGGSSTPILIWSYDTGDEVRCSPSIGANGVLYVGSDSGILYAFGT